MNSQTGKIKGLGIAVTILSAIGAVILAFFIATGGGLAASILNDSGAMNQITQEINKDKNYNKVIDNMNDSEYYNAVNEGIIDINGNLNSSAVQAAGGMVTGIIMAILAIALILTVISLVAGILAIKNSALPLKFGGVMGWNIASAICAFLCGNIIVMVLSIIIAAFASKGKKEALTAGSQMMM